MNNPIFADSNTVTMNTNNNRLTFILFVFCLLSPSMLLSQVFHFQNTSTTIVKTTLQSPAHYYIEIYNDAGIDTTLRWKADVSGVPAAWNITFDDQNNFHNNVQTGDSSDFTLFDSLAFPQKLIIGAWTNNTPGMGSVYFDIYDPANPSDKVTIEYVFIITLATGINSAEPPSEILKIEDNKIYFSFKELTTLNIISPTGQLIYSDKIKNGKYDFFNLETGVYLVYFIEDKKQFVKKFRR